MPVSATALDLIAKAFTRIGTLGVGEPVRAEDAAYGLDTMNAMLDEWSNDALAVFAWLQQSAPLVANQSAYTIGPGGDFDMVRPLSIDDRPGSVYMLDTDGNRYGVDVIQQQDWGLLANITDVTSNYPDTLFYDPQYPLGIMNFYPTPTMTYTAYWLSQLPLSDLTSLATPLSLPPGYVKAIRDNLALELWPDYKTGDPPAMLIRQAAASKAGVKRINTKQRPIHFDAEASAIARIGTWDWRSGIFPSG